MNGEPLELTADEGMRMLKFLNMSQDQLETFLNEMDYSAADTLALWKHMKILDAFIRDNEDEVAPGYEMVPAEYMESVAKLVEAAKQVRDNASCDGFRSHCEGCVDAEYCLTLRLQSALAAVEKGE